MGYQRSPFSMWFSPFDLFYYWSPGYPARQRARLDSGEGYNFLEGIFSFGAPAHRHTVRDLQRAPDACAMARKLRCRYNCVKIALKLCYGRGICSLLGHAASASSAMLLRCH